MRTCLQSSSDPSVLPATVLFSVVPNGWKALCCVIWCEVFNDQKCLHRGWRCRSPLRLVIQLTLTSKTGMRKALECRHLKKKREREEIASVKTGFCKKTKPKGRLRQDSGMCLCMLFAVGLGHFELAEERLRAQRHSVSGFGGGITAHSATLLCFLLGKGLVWCQSVGCCLCPGGCDSGGRTLRASVRGPLPHHHKACPPLTCSHCWWKSAPCPFACSKGGRPVRYAMGLEGVREGGCSRCGPYLHLKLMRFVLWSKSQKWICSINIWS